MIFFINLAPFFIKTSKIYQKNFKKTSEFSKDFLITNALKWLQAQNAISKIIYQENVKKMFRKFQSLISMVTLMSLVISFMVINQETVQAETNNLSEQPTKTDYGKMPLLFEENKGQTDKQAKFVARGSGYTLYLAETEAVFSLKVESQESNVESENPKTRHKTTKSDELKMNFVGANANPKVSGALEAVTKTTYYIGKQRFENLSNYRKVNYQNLYNGIDAVFYGNANNQLEYDFVVSPNADANQIGLNFDGAENVSIDEAGNLVVKTENTELVQQKPFAYQEIDGERIEVASRYVVSENTVKFELGEYDKTKMLVIDPALNYLTYIGGTAFDSSFEVAADAQGNAYISGTTASLDFHGQTRSSNDANGVFVAKINPQGSDFVYITILEGNGNDDGRGIAIDANNNAYVTGVASHFFPTTSGAYDTTHGVVNNDDAFVAKLNTTGGLVYSTFLGGNDEDQGFDVAVDASGKAYVVGDTFSNIAFPSKNKYQGCGFVFPTSLDSLDAFLTVLNQSGSDITYSTCIGGSVTEDKAFSVSLDSSNNAYVTGLAKGGNFPTKNAFQPNSGGGTDAWVAKFNPTASGEASLIYSTYIGGSGTDQGNGIAVNSSGQAHVVGLTGSFNFPLLNAFDSTNQINEAFVTVLSSNGTGLVNSSFLGGADQDTADNVALDPTGSIYVTGDTLSNDFPMALPFQSTRRGLRDAYVAKIKFGRGVISSSYLGGNGNDFGNGVAVKGNFIYVVGNTASTNLLTTAPLPFTPIKATSNNADAFAAKILDTRLDSVGVFRPSSTFVLTQSTTNVVAQNATFTSLLSGQKGVSGDFDGDGIDTIGSFANGTWKTRNVNFPFINPVGVTTFNFGVAGDLPVVGDWDGDGVDTVGTFRPSTGQFFLTNQTNASAINATQQFGTAGDLPISGDWNGDGIDTVGVFRPSVGQFFLTNSQDASPTIDFVAFFGNNLDLPLAGDFDGNGTDTIGVWRTSTAEFFLSNDNVSIARQFVFGAVNTDQPIVGDWDGRPLP